MQPVVTVAVLVGVGKTLAVVYLPQPSGSGRGTKLIKMTHRFLSENATSSTVVAIDKDKNSSCAVKWAIDHLSKKSKTLTLVHVRTKSLQNRNVGTNGMVSKSSNGSNKTVSQQIFKSSRLYCARKGIVVQEVLLEDADVCNALLDYINKNLVTNIILGASARNPIARKFLTPDVPTIINKAAPDFCSVYVISKDKTLSVRPAARSAPISLTPQGQQSVATLSSISRESETDNGSREKVNIEQNGLASEKIRSKNGHVIGLMGDLDILFVRSNKSSSYNNGDFPVPFLSASDDASTQNMELIKAVGKGNNGLSSKELEAKVKRLQLELKQTMDMYNTACKEALLEKQKAKEPNQRQAEEAQIFEMETEKCKDTIKAAEKVQTLPDIEEHRRKYAGENAKQEVEEKYKALTVFPQNDVRYRKYTLEEIELATNNFAMSSKIGEGGYGPVFKGKLDYTPVAIKVLRSDASQGRKQFQQEIEVLSCMRHPNMVILLGACPEYGCLVYEFMDNGSLEDRLFRKGNTPPIPWQIRFKLAADIATGLLFLHQAKPEPLVHRDLKPANILLDHNYICKISDVGLARLVPPSVADSVTQYLMTSAAGTFCYIDPEYQQTGKLGTKSDIYSLGIMLLQIITARPPMGLAHHVERTIQKGTFEDILDPTVPDWPVEEALVFAKLALQCAELRKKDRPDLGSVIVPELNRLRELGMINIMNNRPSYR